MLAEVSDKIPSAAEFWCLHLEAAGVAGLLALAGQRRAVALVLLPMAVAWAAIFAYLTLIAEDPLGDAVMEEMGAGYNADQVMAALMPAVAVVVRLVVGRRREVARGFEISKPGVPADPRVHTQ